MSMDWSSSNAHRGFGASWPQVGVPAGLFLANLVVLGSSWVSGAAFFFFSSRRRHTRFDCDWSSDVCSSDLQFAANYFVAGGGVPAEVDAPDEILLLFVELQRQVDDFLIFVDFRVRLGSEIDESVFAVNFAVGFQGLANFFSGENVALFKRESTF